MTTKRLEGYGPKSTGANISVSGEARRIRTCGTGKWAAPGRAQRLAGRPVSHGDTIPGGNTSDLGRLLERVVAGDQAAWDDVVARFSGLVWSIARGYRLGASTDDVVQTVWLRLARNCDKIRDAERLAAWLATTTRREALRVSKVQKRVVCLDNLGERSDLSVSSLDELVADDDTLQHVFAAFAKLSDKDQELLRLVCAVPAYDYVTIADMLGRSVGSIGPSRERALKKLRKHLPSSLMGREWE